MRRTQPQPTPRLGNNNAVRRVVRQIANLNRKIRPDAMDVLRQGGNVLGALVSDAGDSVVVDDDLWRRRSNVGLR